MLRASASFLFCAALAAHSAAQCTNVSVPGASGCGIMTPFGIPVITCNGAPTVGSSTFGFTTTQACFGTGTPLLGFVLAGSCLTTPQPLASLGALMCGPSQAFCALYVNPVATLGGTPSGTGFSFPLPIPSSPQLVGVQICAQGAHICTTGPCVSASNAISVVVQ
jgi:hypothetical protein